MHWIFLTGHLLCHYFVFLKTKNVLLFGSRDENLKQDNISDVKMFFVILKFKCRSFILGELCILFHTVSNCSAFFGQAVFCFFSFCSRIISKMSSPWTEFHLKILQRTILTWWAPVFQEGGRKKTYSHFFWRICTFFFRVLKTEKQYEATGQFKSCRGKKAVQQTELDGIESDNCLITEVVQRIIFPLCSICSFICSCCEGSFIWGHVFLEWSKSWQYMYFFSWKWLSVPYCGWRVLFTLSRVTIANLLTNSYLNPELCRLR